MNPSILTKIRNSLRFRRGIPVRETQPFPADNAPTKDIQRAPELPAIASRMIRCSGQRKYALRYEGDYYSRLI
jgi:hypothetical protein